MDGILLRAGGQALRTFEAKDLPLEVGSGAGCDIVIHDPEVAERGLLIERGDGGLRLRDLREGRDELRPLVVGAPVAVGSTFTIEAVSDLPSRARKPTSVTEPMRLAPDDPPPLSLVIGHGPDARRVAIGARPILIGSSATADVALTDRSVSGRHCRVEPTRDGFVVRDLGSRNGTWVDGVRAYRARLAPGSRLRVGRTDIEVVARGSRGDARAEGIVARSPAMIGVLGLVERYAALPYRVLVLGPSGAGKEEISRALHRRSARREGAFVAVNAGGLPRDLVESELFGHEKGAFTGAMAARRGLFEQADGGTLFLDEIGELPLSMQARLLRVLETGEVRRVGGESVRSVDVRVIAATHRSLFDMVAVGDFRQDLYYRLAELVIDVPPLAARPADVRALAAHFLDRETAALGPRSITEAAMSRLLAHDWPGNARELRNVIRGAAAESAGVIDAADVDRALARRGPQPMRTGHAGISEVLEHYQGNITAAARALGIPRSTLRDRIAAEGRGRE